MKLFKKLLPLATVASTAAIAAPIITSCSGSNIEIIDPSKPYTPKIDKYVPKDDEKDGVSIDKALEIYLNEVDKNHDIVKDDYYYHLSTQKISNETVNLTETVGIKVTKVDKTNQTIDFEVKRTAKGTVTSSFASEELDVAASVKATNAHIHQYYDGKINFTIGQDQKSSLGTQTCVGKVTGWEKITSEGKTETINYTGKQRTITKDTPDPTDPLIDEEFDAILSATRLQYYSRFLSDLKIK